MREIKFRAWHKRDRKMINFVGQINWDGDFKIFYVGGYENRKHAQNRYVQNRIDCHIPDEVELMQYTGLKDCEGKEIYEGDILKAENGKICIVEWYVNFFVFTKIGHNKSEIGSIMDEYSFKLKIIGNICENPELLEDKNAKLSTKTT